MTTIIKLWLEFYFRLELMSLKSHRLILPVWQWRRDMVRVVGRSWKRVSLFNGSEKILQRLDQIGISTADAEAPCDKKTQISNPSGCSRSQELKECGLDVEIPEEKWVTTMPKPTRLPSLINIRWHTMWHVQHVCCLSQPCMYSGWECCVLIPTERFWKPRAGSLITERWSAANNSWLWVMSHTSGRILAVVRTLLEPWRIIRLSELAEEFYSSHSTEQGPNNRSALWVLIMLSVAK